jgi:hypothetical protein
MKAWRRNNMEIGEKLVQLRNEHWSWHANSPEEITNKIKELKSNIIKKKEAKTFFDYMAPTPSPLLIALFKRARIIVSKTI